MFSFRKKSGAEYREEIARATEDILYSIDKTEAVSPIDRISKIFRSMRSSSRTDLWAHSTEFKEGTAVSPACASRCLRDYERTRCFLRGLDKAIIAARTRFRGEIVRVLYAGCGPDGSLAVPLCCGRLKPGEVQFTFIDIHEASAENIRMVIEELGIRELVAEILTADVITCRHKAPLPHIVVLEAMQPALMMEPQAAITANLASQLHPGGILVPERITLTAYLRGAPEWWNPVPKERRRLGVLYELTKDTHFTNDPLTGRKNISINGVFDLPPAPSDCNLFVGTQVQVFGDETIEEDTAQITGKRFLKFLPHAMMGKPIRVSFEGGASEVQVAAASD